jgi:putative endonuclease
MLSRLPGKAGTRRDGDAAERIAERYLLAHGLVCVERNYRSRFGEIDLIMRHGACLVFVEVRLRKNPHFGGAAASIGNDKQQRIIAAAQHYLSGLRTLPECRFDALLMNEISDTGIEWIQNAFGA